MNKLLGLVLLCVAAAGLLNAQSASGCRPSAGPQAMIRMAARHQLEDREKARSYTWMQREESRMLDSAGKVKSTDVEISEFMLIYGEPFERLISKNGKPISEKDKRKQDEKIDKLIRERQSETPEQRQKRLAEYDKRQAEKLQFAEEVADAYNFTFLPNEQIDGHTAYVLDAVPKPDYHPRVKKARFLSKFQLRFWLDAEDCNWIRIDALAIEPISFGAFIARIGKGTRIAVEQAKVNDEIWRPRHLRMRIDGRFMLLKKFAMEMDIAFFDYRKFRADTRITGVDELPPESTRNKAGE